MDWLSLIKPNRRSMIVTRRVFFSEMKEPTDEEFDRLLNWGLKFK